YLGAGSETDYATGIAVDSAGNADVMGTMSGSNMLCSEFGGERSLQACRIHPQRPTWSRNNLLRRGRHSLPVEAPEHIVANHRLKLVSGLQERALLLQECEHRRRRMHPVAGAGFGKAGASRRASLAQGMILRVLSHPESQHD